MEHICTPAVWSVDKCARYFSTFSESNAPYIFGTQAGTRVGVVREQSSRVSGAVIFMALSGAL